jgi:hypothetical protein
MRPISVMQNRGSVAFAHLTPDGNRLIAASSDGVVNVIPREMFAPFNEILAEAKYRMMRELTSEEKDRLLELH